MYRNRQEMREMIWSLEDALKKKHEKIARMKKREKERQQRQHERREKELALLRELEKEPRRRLAVVHKELDECEETTQQFKEYVKFKKEQARADMKIIAECISETSDFVDAYKRREPKVKDQLDDVLSWLYKKIGGAQFRTVENEGYVGFEDMLLRYTDMQHSLATTAKARKALLKGAETLAPDRRVLRQMNEKVVECQLRARILQLARIIEGRGVEEDPLCYVFFMPTILVGLTYDNATSYHYATELHRLCRRLLAFSEAVQYERGHHNPVVTQSGILSLPNPKDAVPSLYVPVQYADCNGETSAPCEIVVPVAQDSFQCLNVSNGESIAPSDVTLPLAAKDSAVTVVSTSPPKPLLANGEVMACEEKNKLVAKNSIAEIGQK